MTRNLIVQFLKIASKWLMNPLQFKGNENNINIANLYGLIDLFLSSMKYLLGLKVEKNNTVKVTKINKKLNKDLKLA